MSIPALLGYIRKMIATEVGVLLTWALPVVNTGHVTRFDWYALAVAEATAFGVYSIANTPKPAKLEDEPAIDASTPEPVA